MSKRNESRYTYEWYRWCKQYLRSYNRTKNYKSKEIQKINKVIKSLLDKYSSDPATSYIADGIKMVYINNTHKISGAAMDTNVSPSSMHKGTNKFIREIGKALGYMDE